MASIRDLKKDMKKMVEHFIQECYIHLAYSPPTNMENVLDIISDAMQLKDEMIIRISGYNKKTSNTLRKHYYNKISDEFYDRVVELIDRLNSLNY